MQKLIEFIIEHTVRGACTCGLCRDAPKNPEEKPTGHTADLEFFKVSLKNNPDPEVLRSLIEENVTGAYVNVDLFDKKEHGFTEIGGWIGDQSMALMLMGLGELLGLWKLHTPASLNAPKELRMMMAQNGLVSIVSK